MTTMLIAFNGTTSMGQYLGDTLVSLKTAWLFAQNCPCDRYLLAMSPRGELNFLWRKFIDTYKVEIIQDSFDPGDMPARFAAWTKWRLAREIDGVPFDHYRELYRRIDGGDRQGLLCGGERGLGRKNIFEYLYYGQEEVIEPCVGGDHFGNELIYRPDVQADRQVLIAPKAKCQGNRVFTFGNNTAYWDMVVHGLIDAGIAVTVNHDGPFCEDLNGNPLYRKIFPTFPDLLEEVCTHKIVACGNTGVGWLAAAAGVPLLAMQPVDSHIQDYRYEWCGVRSLVEFLETPDPHYCVARIIEELTMKLVLTTGCFDLIHAGHIKHLEESRSLGTRLVVALNSDESVRKLKGEGRPLQKQADRAAILLAMKCVDEVRIFDGADASELIRELRPSILTNGSDHRAEEVVGREYVESYGGRVHITNGDRTVSTSAIVQRIARPIDTLRVIRDVAHLTPNPTHRLKHMADVYLSVKDVPGEVADVGTYRGACGLIFRRLGPGRVLHLYDTWTGNPHDDPLCHHKAGEWAASLDELLPLFGDDPLTHYHQGVFPETAKEVGPFAFVMVDGDTYQTTRDAIAYFWPLMSVGGKMYFDDVPWEPCAGVEKAINEAFGPEQQVRNAEHYSCVVVKT